MKNLFLALAFVISCLLTSCYSINHGTAHDSNSLNIPLHTKKQEIKGSAGYAGFLGFNTDLSFSVTDHLSLKGAGNFNHQHLVRKDIFFPRESHYDLVNHYYEGGIGYFTVFPDSYFNSLEVSSGFGKSTLDKRFGDGPTSRRNDEQLKGSFNKYFLQVNFGHVNEKMELGFGMRYSFLHYPLLTKTLPNSFINSTVTFYEYKNVKVPVMEFCGMVAAGGKNLKGTVQLGMAVPLKNKKLVDDDGYDQVDFHSAICQFGLRYNIK